MKFTSHFLALLMTLLWAPASAQPEKTAFSDLSVLAPQLTRLQNQFEQMLPPGVSIEAKEVYRKGKSGTDLQVRYNIYVKGVPPDSVFRQLQWPVDREKPMAGFSGITLNADGLMICAGRTSDQCHNGDKLDAPVQFTRTRPLKGEPMRFIFVAQNLRIPISTVPDPVQAEDRGCKLNVIRLSAKFELALIEASGFPPNSEVRLHTSDRATPTMIATFHDDGKISMSDRSAGVAIKTDNEGAIQTTVLNNTTRTPTGTETVAVSAPGCSPSVSYEWGVF
jgi:hypothetical protein